MTPDERVSQFESLFPKYPAPQVVDGKLYGLWLIGNTYRRINDLYGSYPHSYLERMTALFPELPRLHLFSGKVRDPAATTFDINPEHKPHVVGDVMDIGSLAPEAEYAAVLADPPYNDKARGIYNTQPFNKRRAIIEVATVVAPGGHLIWLDTITPVWSKRYWTWAGAIALHTGTNCVVRIASLLRRNEPRQDA